MSKINNLNECRFVSYKNRLRRDSLTLNEMYELTFFYHLFKSLFSSLVQGQLDKVKVLPLFVEFIHVKNLIKINCRYKSFMAS